jgi:Ca-activated chloride channel family protein
VAPQVNMTLSRFSYLVGWSLLAILTCPITFAQTTAFLPKFRADTQLVLVPVTVTDHSGKTIQGLSQDNFTVLDDQASQQIVSFSTADAPCAVGLVLDISRSMRDSLQTAKEVTRSFLGSANPEDEFLLLTVSTNPEPISGFTKNLASLERSIDSARPGGATALIDTVYLALTRMRNASQPRRALLILSDGMDNHSRYSKSELMRVAIEADVQIYAVITDGIPDGTFPVRPAMIRKPWDNGEQNQGRSLLEDLADKSGGLHFRVRREGAGDAATKAGQAIRSQYVIGYQPPAARDSGKWHRLRVKLDVPHLNVYARNGYYSR